jgi:hypothetical protein
VIRLADGRIASVETVGERRHPGELEW